MKRQVFGALAFLLATACALGALSAYTAHQALYNPSRVSARSLGGAKFSDMDKLLELDGAHCGFSQALKAPIEAKATGQGTTVDALYVRGDASLIGGVNLLSGAMPEAGYTCAIDSETALSLIGSLDVIGQEIELNADALTIVGVFKRAEGLLGWGADPGRGLIICPYTLAEDQEMDGLEIVPRAKSQLDARYEAEDQLSDAGISAGEVSGYADALMWSRAVLSLPRLVLFVLTLISAVALVRVRQALPIALAILVVIASAYFLRLDGGVPQSMLPTRWADFGFWESALESAGTARADAALLPALRPDVLSSAILSHSALLSYLSVALYIASYLISRHWLCALCYPLVLPAFGSIPFQPQMLMLPALYAGVNYYLARIDNHDSRRIDL